jgi:CRISPR-associated protein Csd2
MSLTSSRRLGAGRVERWSHGDKVTESDVDLNVVKALAAMFDHDHSAAPGTMAMRRLTAFRHSSGLGNARASDLFDCVSVRPRIGTPRSFADFEL